MTLYSVATAKAELPRLIDKALAGEEVIITRHGRPVAEVRPPPAKARESSLAARRAATERLLARRLTPASDTPSAVELVDLVYEDRSD